MCHDSAIRARLITGKVLAAICEPYFDRMYGHYCSHMNTPYRLEDAAHPGAWRTKNVVCLAHPVGHLYYTEGARLHRDYFINALRLLYPAARQSLWTGMPSGGRVSLVYQPQKRRYCAHLLYGPPMLRGRCQVIEDLVPLYDVPVRLRVPEKVVRVWLPLSRRRLKWQKSGGRVVVTVPVVKCHEVMVFEYNENRNHADSQRFV